VAALSGLVGQLAGEIAAELGGATPSPAR